MNYKIIDKKIYIHIIFEIYLIKKKNYITALLILL